MGGFGRGVLSNLMGNSSRTSFSIICLLPTDNIYTFRSSSKWLICGLVKCVSALQYNCPAWVLLNYVIQTFLKVQCNKVTVE